MNKTELITAIAEETKLSKKDVEAMLNATVKVVTETIAADEKVQIVGFGSFESKLRPARIGRNPRTKEEVLIPESKAPVFKAGRGLKDAMTVKKA